MRQLIRIVLKQVNKEQTIVNMNLDTAVLYMGGVGLMPATPVANKITDNHEFFRIMSDYRNQVYVVERQCAESLLEYYRHVLMSFSLRRHVVTIWAAKGTCGLCINGKPMQSQYTFGKWSTRGDPVLRVLREIEQSLEYKFAYYLEGMTLN